jgi:hypothetical protein
MTPGLWIEPEVVGVHSPVADTLPTEAFFQRNGQRVKEMGRYQLDYRHPAVTARMDAVINNLVTGPGVGYFKPEYNLDITQSTDINRTAPGNGPRPQPRLLRLGRRPPRPLPRPCRRELLQRQPARGLRPARHAPAHRLSRYKFSGIWKTL